MKGLEEFLRVGANLRQSSIEAVSFSLWLPNRERFRQFGGV